MNQLPESHYLKSAEAEELLDIAFEAERYGDVSNATRMLNFAALALNNAYADKPLVRDIGVIGS